MARPQTPPSAFNSPQPTDPFLSHHPSPAPSPRPPHSAINLTPNPNDYHDSSSGSGGDDYDDDKEIDRTLAYLEQRRSHSGLLPGSGGGAGSSSSNGVKGPAGAPVGGLSGWLNALSRRLASRSLSRRALLALVVGGAVLVSLYAGAVRREDLEWRGLRRTGGRWKDRAVRGWKTMVWSQVGLENEDEVTGPFEALDVLKVLNYNESRPTMKEQLKPGVRYVTAMAYGGHANQFISIMRMLYMGQLTNRVGIIPTLVPVHIDGNPVPMSTFYDLPRFWTESRIPAVEFTQVKPLDLDQQRPHNEMLPCWSVQEATAGFANLEAWSFDLHDIWVQHWALPPLARALGGFDLAFDALRLFDFDTWAKTEWVARVRREWIPQKPPADPAKPYKGDLSKNMKDGFEPVGSQVPDDQLLCFDNTLFLGPVMFPELPVTERPLEPNVPGEGLSWMNVGQHLRFNDAVESRADEYLAHLFGVASPAQIPPFITIHLRRGDFKDFTGFTSLDKYKSALTRVQAALQKRLDDPVNWTGPGRRAFRTFGKLRAEEYAVVATTDESGESEFVKEVRGLGWKVLDHGKTGFDTAATLGAWWPTMIDGAVLARGRSFVGTDRSTFSHIAGLRVKYWRGGLVETAY
ncbi:hypothetical protein JCM6882_001380 [Rhodosporidiobolus microsporus]